METTPDLETSRNNKEGGYINVKPFWVCPRNILWHNLYISSQSRLQYKSHLLANILGNGALIGVAVQFQKLPLYIALQIGLWTVWLLSTDLRPYLTSPELLDVINLAPPVLNLPF